MTPDQVLEQAAHIIERDGWRQGSLYALPDSVERAMTDDDWQYGVWQGERNGPVCSMGAIHRAISGNAGRVWSDVGQQLRADAGNLLLDQVAGRGFGDIPSFNDAVTTTKEDVLLVFKRAVRG